jgi:hypothetical protein
MTTLVEELNALHAAYVDLVNNAIEEGDAGRAEQLAAAYDTEAIELIAEREGKTHLLPLRRPVSYDTPLRRLAQRLSLRRAA